MSYPYPKLSVTGIVVLAIIFLFSLSLSLNSCRKTDFGQNDSEKDEAFFRTTSKDLNVLRLIQSLKAENQRTGFVSKLPKNSGAPIWDKYVMRSKKIDKSIFWRGANGEPDSVVVIPFTSNNENLSAIIVYDSSTVSPSLNCYTTNGNLYAECHNANVNVDKAEQMLAMFMQMENRVFGTTVFYHIPAKIFKNPALPDTATSEKMLVIDTVTVQGFAADDCFLIKFCNPGGVCTPPTYCDNCSVCPWIYYCDTPPGDGGGGGGGGTGEPPTTPTEPPTGGGGGGGTPPPPPEPCPFGGAWYNFVPSTEPCGPNTPPFPTEDPPSGQIIIYDSSFQNTRLQCTYEAAELRSQNFRNLNNIFDLDTIVRLTLHVDTLLIPGSFAITRGFNNFRYVITSDPGVDTASDIFRMTVLSHELIHAKLYYALELAGLMHYTYYGEPSLDTSNGALNTPLANLSTLNEAERLRILIRQYNISCAGTPGGMSNWAHYLFGTTTFNNQVYRNYLQQLLFEGANWSQEPPSYVQMMTNRFGVNWRQKVCEYLSWFGLRETPAFDQFLQTEGITEDAFETVIENIRLNANKNCL